jgi:hypothetical protein
MTPVGARADRHARRPVIILSGQRFVGASQVATPGNADKTRHLADFMMNVLTSCKFRLFMLHCTIRKRPSPHCRKLPGKLEGTESVNSSDAARLAVSSRHVARSGPRVLHQIALRSTHDRLSSWPGLSGPTPQALAAIGGPDTLIHDGERPQLRQCIRRLVFVPSASSPLSGRSAVSSGLTQYSGRPGIDPDATRGNFRSVSKQTGPYDTHPVPAGRLVQPNRFR